MDLNGSTLKTNLYDIFSRNRILEILCIVNRVLLDGEARQDGT